MRKKILLAGASGLVGSNLLQVLEKNKSKLILLSRKRLENQISVEQIITNFDDIKEINYQETIDEVYIAIGKKLSLLELIYIKKENQRSFQKVDFDYIKSIAEFALSKGAKSIALISAVGANSNSKNLYLNVKGKVEEEILSLGFEKVVIARPSHLLGKRVNEKTNPVVLVFEKITNLTGYLLFGPLKKFRNVHAKIVASSLVSKMNNEIKGKEVLYYDDFKSN
tara:strand:- start:156 stop:827 length:672 start_codon:yes stop_codon:yes gene_type:complete